MESWSPERAAAIASDAAALAAAQSVATPRKWSALGRSERAIWGLCHGSGKQPYQTIADVHGPGFKCSCPSRKIPCKHGLGLLLLFARRPDALPAGDEPTWVADWIAERRQRAAKKAAAAASAERTIDVDGRARRAAQRTARVRDGVAVCRVWLDDLIRRGLAAAQQDPDGDWERTAARLVDAQAPGLASLVRRIPLTMASGAGWETRTLDLVGRLHLLLCAAERLDALPPDVAGDVRTALGWTQSQDEALASAPVADRWLAMAQVIEEEERFRIVRTWLVGERTTRRALLLEFAAGDRPLERTIVAGTAFDGELVYYPSRAPLRALIRTGGDIRPLERDPGELGDQTIDDALLRYAEALAANPWVVRWPLILAHVRPAQEGARWFLVDRQDHAVPLRAGFTQSLQLWRLVSVSAGRPITVVVEWDGTAAVPVGAFARPDSAVDLTPGWAA